MPISAPDSIVLFPTSYPYDLAAEHTFLRLEIEHLAANFKRLILVPNIIGGRQHVLPKGVEVEESYASLHHSVFKKTVKILGSAALSRLFYRELLAAPKPARHPKAILRNIMFAGRAELTRRWVSDFIQRKKLDTSRCLFYTYWLTQTSMGIGLAKKNEPNIFLVSRAHGSDLYPDRFRPTYMPCQAQTLQVTDRVFTISGHGKQYIDRQYPWYASRCEIARLGVRTPGFRTNASSDGVLRIISCSNLIPLKRVGLLIQGIAFAAMAQPTRQFEWHHFGDGPLKAQIEAAAQSLPPNVKGHLPGNIPNEVLTDFYHSSAIDIFVNVSEHEGIPVSIMEATSCGIPIIATAVGGNPEIVDERNGKLLSPNPTPEEIGTALLEFLSSGAGVESQRAESYQIWQEHFDADYNFQNFVQRLKLLR